MGASGTTAGRGKFPSRYNQIMKCPKCANEASDDMRFCPRCHATLRYECPSCHHEQRQGVSCEKCGVDFLKYAGFVVTAEKAASDAARDRAQRRSVLLKGILFAPFTAGIPLIRQLFIGSRKDNVR